MSETTTPVRQPDAEANGQEAAPSAGPLPAASPDPAWVEAEAALQAHLAQVQATVETQWAHAQTRENQRWEALRDAVAQAASRHQALRDEARFDEGGVSADVLWQRTCTYRQAVRESVIRPLRQHLAQPVLGDMMGRIHADLFRALVALPEGLPELVTVPEPPGLYEPQADDSPVRRVRKRGVQWQRDAQRRLRRLTNGLRRLVSRAPRPLPARSTVVPLRVLVDYHIQVRLPVVLLPAYETVQNQAACVAARVEAGLAAWVRDFLKAERKLDRAAFHAPSLPAWERFGPDAAKAGEGATHPAAENAPPAEGPAQAETARAAAVSLAEHAEALDQATAALQQVLDTALGDDTTAADLTEPLQTAAGQLAEDVRRGGTFLLDLGKRRLPEDSHRPLNQVQQRQQVWAAWHEQVVQRMDLALEVVALRQDLEKQQEGLLARAAAATLQPVFQTFAPVIARLQKATQEVEAACDAAAGAEALGDLRTTIGRVQEDTVRYLQKTLDSVAALVQADKVLDEPGEEEENRVHRRVQQLPEMLAVHLPQKPPIEAVDLRAPTLRIELRAIADEALSVPLPVQLKEPAQKFRGSLLVVWGETEQIQHIVQYNLEAALDELKRIEAHGEPQGAGASGADKPADWLASARELSSDGLRRAAQTLQELPRGLYAPWMALSQAAFEAFSGEWDVLRLRIQSNDVMEQRWVGLRMQLARRLRLVWRDLKAQWLQHSTEALRYLRFGQRQARRLIQRGQSAVGVLSQTEEARLDTVSAITNIDQLLAELPLVYRKLFAFEPVAVPSLMEGRGRDLVRVRGHYTRWHEQHQAGALVLALPLGSGRTSFLNVLRATVFEEADVRTLSLDERLTHPDQFAVHLAAMLGVDVTRPTLDGLERYLRNRPEDAQPLVCMIDNLEHLLLQKPGGSDLIERALIFFSRTDLQVYWVAAIGSNAWHFLERTASAASGLVTAHQFAPLNRESLKAILINRHRRSGMPLRFAEPRDPSALLRQRLRRAKTPEEQQAVLREEYFDRLYRLSGQNVMLALYYWLRSTDFEVEEGALVIRQPQPLDFGFLKSFDLARAFTLKAFIVHNTLTLEEHNLIFRLNEEQGTFLLESLLNQRMIEPVPVGPEQTVDVHGPIVSGVRYRISPLLVHPVTEHLRSRHIIY